MQARIRRKAKGNRAKVMKKSHSLVFATLLFSDEIDAQWKPALVECDVEAGGYGYFFFKQVAKSIILSQPTSDLPITHTTHCPSLFL